MVGAFLFTKSSNLNPLLWRDYFLQLLVLCCI